jgi:glycosyltransferase 2 family protein
MNKEFDSSELFVQEGPEGEIHAVKKRKKLHRSYIFNISLVLLITGLILFFNLRRNLDEVALAMTNIDLGMFSIVVVVIMLVFVIEGLILYILARLYTTRYSFKKAIANGMIGNFYNNITPAHSGGQFAQAYTFKKQGLDISSAASILVMHFLLNQIALVTYGVIALFARLPKFLNIIQPIVIGNLSFPTIALALMGFAVNALVILSIVFLAYSKTAHDFLINGIVKLLGKMRIIRRSQRVIDNLQIQIENFRIELRRLQSNLRVTITLFLMFMLRFTLLYSLPYLIGRSLPTIAIQGGFFEGLWDGIFMTSYLYLIANLFPLPGAAGISELAFSHLFQWQFGSFDATLAPQIIWRAVTFYLTLVISGLISAFYRSAPQEDNFKSDRRTFVDLQRSTYAVRKQTSDTQWKTAQLSRKEIERKMLTFTKDIFGIKKWRAKRQLRKNKEENKNNKDADAS